MRFFSATRYVASVDLINVDDLCDAGIKCVLVDRDNTLVPRDTKVAPPEVRAWLKDLASVGISVCMVSNNFHTQAVCESAKDLGIHVVHHAMKPAPVAIHVALSHMGASKKQAVLVGDQLFTDVMAGNLAGVETILVKPQCTKDLFYTQLFRKFENLFLRNIHYEGDA